MALDLHALAAALRDEGFDAAVVDDDEHGGAVVAPIPCEGLPVPVELAIAPVDTGGDPLEGVQLVQFYAGIPVELDDDEVVEAVAALPELAVQAPLPGFSVLVDEGVLYYRHVLVAPLDGPGRVLVETSWLVRFTLDTMARPVLDRIGSLE